MNTKIKKVKLVGRANYAKRGRPLVKDPKTGEMVGKKVKWPAPTNFIWRNTDRDIAEKLGCSVVAVFLRRRKYTAEGFEKQVKSAHLPNTRAKVLKVA